VRLVGYLTLNLLTTTIVSGSSILTLLGSGHQTCMKLTTAECTVENS